MPMTIKEIIESKIRIAFAQLGVEVNEIVIEQPNNPKNGDFSSNIALKIKGRNPLETAKQLVQIIEKDALFEKIEAVKPGFVNFFLTKEYLHEQVREIISQGKDFGSVDLGKGKKASVEYISANPTGPLHIGNARGGPIGDVLANVLEKSGYEVTREYLHNDVGGQVKVLGTTVKAVVEGREVEEGQYKGEYISELAKQLKHKISGKTEDEVGKIAVDIIFDWIMEDVGKMGIHFDKVRNESDLRNQVEPLLEKLKPFLKEKDGALWFAPNDEFLKDRETVVKKSNGELTYFSADIAYHNNKLSQNDLVVDILGSNHSGHVPRLKAVAKSLGYDPEKLKIILYQYVRIKKEDQIVKMSKRAGDFVTAREILDEVGKDAFRYFLLTSKPEGHIDFDVELAKKQANENPVFYIQYAYSRICSIFKKMEGSSFISSNVTLLNIQEELDLIRHLIKFPDLIEEISTVFNINILTTYSFELASKFHKLYETALVISDNKELTDARLALLKATQTVLQNTLSVMGISAPERM